MPSKVQLIGGAFQDSEGNILTNGQLKFRLSQDASVSGVGNICSGVEVIIQLDADGNVVSSPAQYLWGNDSLLPINTYYRVTGYTFAGQPAWGPNNQQVEGSGTFDLGTWVPNSVISWLPVVNQPLVLKNNGVLNSSQALLNLESSDSSVTITDEGGGNINLQAGGGTFQNTIGSTAAGVVGNSFSQGSNIGMALTPIGNSALGISSGPSATEGCFVPLQGSSSDQVGALIDVTFNISLGILKDWFCKVTLVGTTSSRYWMGISDTTSSNVGNVLFSDTPAANFVGFLWSSSVGGGGNYNAVCQTDATHQTLVDTGVSLGVGDKLEFKSSGSSVLFYINGSLVATISTNVPSTSLGLSSVLTNDCDGNVEASNYQMNWYYVYAILNY
jgi:hypothetical protein